MFSAETHLHVQFTRFRIGEPNFILRSNSGLDRAQIQFLRVDLQGLGRERTESCDAAEEEEERS
jgi:hypothetical protein